MEAGDYTTGSIPRIRLDEEAGRRAAPDEPEVSDGYDDADPAAYDGDDGRRRTTTPDALPPIGRDADAPRRRGGIFRRHKAVQTSDR